MLSKPSTKPRSDLFGTTHWTQVCLAKSDSDEGRRALAELCDVYYDPVLTYLRCEFGDMEAARDTAHAFFAQMLSGNAIHTADQHRGRFRSYLIGAVKHFVSHKREAARRLKRGDGPAACSLDDDEVLELADGKQPAPDDEFDRQWAVTVLSQALHALHRECELEGKGTVFETLRPWLTGDAALRDQVELAASLGMNVNSLKSLIYRLRQRFRFLVKKEVASTLDTEGNVDAEMAALLAALRKK